VARSLICADRPVRAVVRDRSKGAVWAALGCDVAVADLSDAAALSGAFEGTEGVFAMLASRFRPGPGLPRGQGVCRSAARGAGTGQARQGRGPCRRSALTCLNPIY